MAISPKGHPRDLHVPDALQPLPHGRAHMQVQGQYVVWPNIGIFDLTNVVTQVGSTNFNDERMVFGQETLSFDQEQSNTILDYQVIRDGGEQD